MREENVDLLVIGWGKGGKTLAAAAGAAGQRVAVVEQDPGMAGGACINIACVPTTALIHDADARRPDDDPQPYFDAAVARRDALTTAMRDTNFGKLDALDSVLLVTGHARFVGPKTVEVTSGDDALRISAATVVVNTGSTPTVPPIEGARIGGRIHDSRTLQHVHPLPERLVVVGGGYVGLEFASMFAHYGSAVTVLDHGPRPLRHEDPDVAATAAAALEEDGVRLVAGASVTRINDGTDAATVSYTANGAEQRSRPTPCSSPWAAPRPPRAWTWTTPGWTSTGTAPSSSTPAWPPPPTASTRSATSTAGRSSPTSPWTTTASWPTSSPAPAPAPRLTGRRCPTRSSSPLPWPGSDSPRTKPGRPGTR